ncbi:MAG: rod shape-determining protein MreD [Muribaculaceae bacterium]|nr:rod shape-determining protein MreD [Muribaculaceae bacterium]
MTKTIIHFILLSLVMILLQTVCNKIILFDVAVPLVFIYVILRLPINWHSNIVLTIAFLMGLLVDVFNNTPGMNALSCTVLAGVRPAVFNAYVPRGEELAESTMPSISSLGIGVYAKYMVTLVLIYCTLIFFIQAFTVRDVLLTIERVLASTLLTAVILLGLDSLVSTKREKGL